MKRLDLDATRVIHVDASKVTNLDIVGAWLLRNITRKPRAVRVLRLVPRFQPTFTLLNETLQEFQHQNDTASAPSHVGAVLWHIGTSFLWLCSQLVSLTGYLGLVAIETSKTILHVKRLRVAALLDHIQDTGLKALPIVGLLSFAIGIVLAYQGAEQLKKFGAEQLTIDFLGIGTLRETGVLIAAIMIAGRSGSAFTAQIGTMKLTQEIDAIEILGLESVSVLVLPRIVGLLIALPVLTLYSDVMSILGGSALCYFYLHISLTGFFHHLQTTITVQQLMIGFVKAPFFAVIIAFIGCFEGAQVSRDSVSVGTLTTLSVVESIFLVILVDALFSIMFSIMGV